MVARTQWWQRGQRKVDWGFTLEVELTHLGKGWLWVVRRGRIQGCLPVFWPEQLGGRWYHFLRWGRHREGQVGEEIKSLLLDLLHSSRYLSCLVNC